MTLHFYWTYLETQKGPNYWYEQSFFVWCLLHQRNWGWNSRQKPATIVTDALKNNATPNMKICSNISYLMPVWMKLCQSKEADLLFSASLIISNAYLDSALVRLIRNVTIEHVPNVLFTRNLFTPHLQVFLLTSLTLQIEQIIVSQITKWCSRWISPSTVRKFVPGWRSMNVTLWSTPPENRSHVLLWSRVICCLFPW